MNYINGEEVKLGDKVIADKSNGIVVALVSDKQFLEEYGDWTFLEAGLMIETEETGLVHYPEIDEDIVFVGRRD